MSEPAWDRELVLTELGLIADLVANTDRIVTLLEEEDGPEEEED